MIPLDLSKNMGRAEVTRFVEHMGSRIWPESVTEVSYCYRSAQVVLSGGSLYLRFHGSEYCAVVLSGHS